MACNADNKPFWPRLWATKEKSRFIRTITLIWMMWITTKTFLWAMSFAQTTDNSPMETAALIGAILTPIAGLHGAVFKFYSSKSYSDKQED